MQFVAKTLRMVLVGAAVAALAVPSPAAVPAGFTVCGIPPTARALAVNVTVTAPTGPGHLRLWAADELAPRTSTINFMAGQTRANNAVVKLGAGGSFSVLCGMPSGSTHLIVDVTGYFQ